jgi:PKD repeat protein
LANYSISYVAGVLTVVDTTPPAISTLTPAGGQLLALGNPASVTANFSDSCSVASVRFCWDDSSPDTVLSGSSLTSQTTGTAVHTYASAGVYTVTVKVTDGCGNSVEQKYQFAVVYDPSAGFVTGGGWITSGAGAYVPNPALVGKANFGFSSQYKKGAQVPTGETEFQFQIADLNFHSTAYQWLVVSGAKGQYKGTGTLNGVAGYGFLLTATDGQLVGGGSPDKFRIKITNSTGATVYDNAPGLSDDIDKVDPQAIGGGSIVIHK